MSEDVMGKLGSFTPAAVDRDALLFAAGRASAKPSRFWKFATAALAASQLVTLGLWLAPRSVPAHPVPESKPAVPDDAPSQPLDPYSLLAMSRNPDVESKSVPFSPGPSRPPLTAFTRNFQP